MFDRQAVATITNAGGLSAVTEMLRSGRPAKPHECAARGTMEARFADGRSLAVAFAPGHESSHYEFGMDGHLFTISRARFLDALAEEGLMFRRSRQSERPNQRAPGKSARARWFQIQHLLRAVPEQYR